MFKQISLALLILIALPVFADDYYLIEMNTAGQNIDECSRVFWDADAVFYNLGSQDEVVTLAGVSNGGVIPGIPSSFHVAPGRTTTLRQALGIPWEPGSVPPVWIVHVNAPSSLLVESAMPLSVTGGGGSDRFCRIPVFFKQQYGKTQLPVFRSVVPAGQRQVIHGLSIGDVPGHINVAVYNAGADFASATIEVHRACDGAITESRNVVVEANAVQQVTGFAVPDSATACAPLDPSAALTDLAYVVVTIDQPSITFASILGSVPATNNQPVSTIQVMPGVAR